MSVEPQTFEPDPPTDIDARLNTYLFSMLDVGERVVQSVGRQADLQAQPTPEGQTPAQLVDVAAEFECVARAMRRDILLVRHIAQPRAAANDSRIATNPARHRTEARKRIIREVEDRIGRGSDSDRASRDLEGLRAEFRERLDAPDLEEDITSRPIPDIIKDICADLGLEDPFGYHVHQRRTPRDIDALNARAAAPRPPGPYDPAPHGPDPGAPQPKHPPKPPDRAKDRAELDRMTIRLARC